MAVARCGAGRGLSNSDARRPSGLAGDYDPPADAVSDCNGLSWTPGCRTAIPGAAHRILLVDFGRGRAGRNFQRVAGAKPVQNGARISGGDRARLPDAPGAAEIEQY